MREDSVTAARRADWKFIAYQEQEVSCQTACNTDFSCRGFEFNAGKYENETGRCIRYDGVQSEEDKDWTESAASFDDPACQAECTADV